MNGRRAILKALVAGAGDALTAAAVTAFAGEASVATRNHVYRFRDGICVAVTHREDPLPAAKSAPFLGMRMLGWLIDGTGEGDPPRLSHVWQSGACAILRRTTASHRDSLALTSPTVQCLRPVHLASTPSRQSMTRINIAPAEPI